MSTVAEGVSRALSAVRRHEPRVRAWAYLDEEGCRTREALPGPLSGLTIGVKDLIDTAGMPTSYGSPIYKDHRPRADAAVVRLLRDAGGFVLGKTVTTEFAVMTPGPTTNPWRETHTPGGSSSGSAAAVACGMADLAVGTQTYGSLIRPASFCGVWAFKPTRGLVPIDGLKPLAPSFDQVGWFARTPTLLETVHGCLTGALPVRSLPSPRLGVLDLTGRDDLDPAVPRALKRLCDRADGVVLELGALLAEITAVHHTAASHEIARNLRPETKRHADLISAPLRGFLAEGAAVSVERHAEALARLDVLRTALEEALSAVDVLVTPSAPGEAPYGLGFTGDPVFCSPWTAVGFPALNLPGATGATGLPVGLQLVAAPGRDTALLAAARRLA